MHAEEDCWRAFTPVPVEPAPHVVEHAPRRHLLKRKGGHAQHLACRQQRAQRVRRGQSVQLCDAGLLARRRWLKI